MNISVVIVNYNTKDFLLGCIKSLVENNQCSQQDITVVDNASVDGSLQTLKKQFPEVKAVCNNNNIGFGKANNGVLKDLNTKYVLIINPDVVVLKDSLRKMAEFMDVNTDIGIVGPDILGADHKRQYSGITFPNNFNFLCESIYLDRLFPKSKYFARQIAGYRNWNNNMEVDYLQGSCLLIRKILLDEIGLFDERYFMYFEETDLCYRAKKAGWKIFRLAEAPVIHFGCGDAGYYDEGRIYNYHKSQVLFYLKHYKRVDCYMLKMILFVRSIIRILSWVYLMVFCKEDQEKVNSRIRGYLRVIGLVICSGRPWSTLKVNKASSATTS